MAVSTNCSTRRKFLAPATNRELGSFGHSTEETDWWLLGVVSMFNN
jgi:hypothetical protein